MVSPAVASTDASRTVTPTNVSPNPRSRPASRRRPSAAAAPRINGTTGSVHGARIVRIPATNANPRMTTIYGADGEGLSSIIPLGAGLSSIIPLEAGLGLSSIMPLGAGLSSIIPLAAGLGLSSIIPLGAGTVRRGGRRPGRGRARGSTDRRDHC